MTDSLPPLMPTSYQIQVGQELIAGRKIMESCRSRQDQQKKVNEWAAAALKRSRSELAYWAAENGLEEEGKQLRRDWVTNSSGEALRQLAKHGQLDEMRALINDGIDGFDAERAFQSALHWGQDAAARLMDPLSDHYDPPSEVSSALWQAHPISSEYCIELINRLHRDQLVEHMEELFSSAAHGGRMDLLKHLHVQSLRWAPLSESALFRALKNAATYEHQNTVDWLVDVAGANPERIFVGDWMTGDMSTVDVIAVKIPWSRRSKIWDTLSPEVRSELPLTETRTQAEGRAQRVQLTGPGASATTPRRQRP